MEDERCKNESDLNAILSSHSTGARMLLMCHKACIGTQRVSSISGEACVTLLMLQPQNGNRLEARREFSGEDGTGGRSDPGAGKISGAGLHLPLQ